jgi:hypothetical protein
VVHLNEMQEKYAEKGLTVLAISKQAKADVEKFVEELKATHPVVCESSDSMRAFGARSYPSSYLVGANGRVVWAGHPVDFSDALVEETLAKTKILPALPKALAAHEKGLEKGKYGAVLTKVESEVASGRHVAEEDAAAAKALEEWLRWYGTSSLEAASAQVEGGDVHGGWLAMADVEEAFKGHALGNQAKAAAAKVKADPARALEIKAGEMLGKIREDLGDEDDLEKVAAAMKPLLGKKYAGTRAGRRAAELAEGKDPDAAAPEKPAGDAKPAEGEEGEAKPEGEGAGDPAE